MYTMASNIALTNTNGFTSNLLTTTGTAGSGGGPVTSTVNGGSNNNSKKQIFVWDSVVFLSLY
jgi:hypothetical protein